MTSNLIAFWRAETDRRAAEAEALHNKVMERQNERRMNIDEALNRMNLQIAQFRANEEARHNAAQERLTALGQTLQAHEIALGFRRQEETERYNREQIAQAERNRVTNSYLEQRKQNMDDRYRTRSLAIEEAKMGVTKRGQDINAFTSSLATGVNFALGLGNLGLSTFTLALGQKKGRKY